MESFVFNLTAEYYRMVKVTPCPKSPGVISEFERQLLLEQDKKRWDKLFEKFNSANKLTPPSE